MRLRFTTDNDELPWMFSQGTPWYLNMFKHEDYFEKLDKHTMDLFDNKKIVPMVEESLSEVCGQPVTLYYDSVDGWYFELSDSDGMMFLLKWS